MSIEIIGDVDPERIYCAASGTKFLTTFVCLSLLSETHILKNILDDENFLDSICVTLPAKNFLHLFQQITGSKFTLRDICSYYAGLPYTFDLSEQELASVEAGNPFKHHSIPDEETFLSRCKNNITPVYPVRAKFHYSEISIIFLGYLIEKIYNVTMEDLYKIYITDKFNLIKSSFSRVRVKGVYCEDLSDKYDYASIAILDHGYFCYSNGYYTTLNEMKILLENIVENPVFKHMIDVAYARAASPRLMNGLTVEIRMLKDDVLVGYEGLSFSGCNLWAYSTKHNKGYLTFSNDEESIYDVIYNKFGGNEFDKVPAHTQVDYAKFLKHYIKMYEEKNVPEEYQGNYHRVKINEKDLKEIFVVGKDFMIIRNPEEIRYEIIYLNGNYRIKNKDRVHGAKVGFYQAESGNKYMCFDGVLYLLPLSPSSRKSTWKKGDSLM